MKRNARDTRPYKCKENFLTFKIMQANLSKDELAAGNMKAYATTDAEWDKEHSVDVSHIVQATIDRNGILTKENMENIFGRNLKTIQGEVRGAVLEAVRLEVQQVNSAHPVPGGKERQPIKTHSVKLGPCGCTFNTPEEYNEHFH